MNLESASNTEKVEEMLLNFYASYQYFKNRMTWINQMIRPEWERWKPMAKSNYPAKPANLSKNIYWFTHFQILLFEEKKNKIIDISYLIEKMENRSYSYYGFEVWKLKRWDSENRIPSNSLMSQSGLKKNLIWITFMNKNQV